MPRRKPQAPKEGPVWKLSAVEATLQEKPRYNRFACGYGAHGDLKYNRTKEHIRFRDMMKEYCQSKTAVAFQDVTAVFDNPIPKLCCKAVEKQTVPTI